MDPNDPVILVTSGAGLQPEFFLQYVLRRPVKLSFLPPISVKQNLQIEANAWLFLGVLYVNV